MLSVSDYRVSYGQSEVLHGLNFEIKPREIVAVMGRNGMGKTTLMKSLMGVIPSSGGSVKLDGKEVSQLKSYQRVAGGSSVYPFRRQRKMLRRRCHLPPSKHTRGHVVSHHS